MTEVILQGYILVPAEDLKLVLLELPRHIELTRQEAGCIVFQVERDPEDHHRFNVYEKFSNQQAFEAHQARVKQSHWGMITKNVERHYKIS